jgi:hypothetical protein
MMTMLLQCPQMMTKAGHLMMRMDHPFLLMMTTESVESGANGFHDSL